LFDRVATAIQANFEQLLIMETSIITLDNIRVLNVDTTVAFTNGNTLNLPVVNIDFVVVRNLEANGSNYG
jgi:hypothetical protein